MANFRNFTIYNRDKTESIDLNSFEGYLVTTPVGIGVYFKNTYFDIGSKRILTEQKSAFKDISLIVDIFAPTRVEIEEKYNYIRNFIARNRVGGFRLAYKPYDNAQERYIECDIKDFDKSEKTTSRMMTVPLTVEPRTLWRVDINADFSSAEQTSGWSFDIDSDLAGFTSYDVSMSDGVGERELSIPGYDKSTLPQSVSLKINARNYQTGDVYEEAVVGLDKAIFWNDGRMIVKHPIADDILFFLIFDTDNSSIKGSIQKRTYTSTTLPSNLYSATLLYGQDRNIEKIEFDDSVVNVECTIELGLVGARKRYLKEKGQKVVYLKFSSTLRLVSISINQITSNISTDSNITWRVSGSIAKGIGNYLESFDYESETLTHNIQFFGGGVSRAEITNNGDEEIPLRLTVSGLAVNPEIRIYPHGASSPIQRTKLNFTIPQNARLEIDGDPENTGAWIIYDTGIVNNAISYLDTTTNMFLTLPKGSYDIQVVDDNSNPIRGKVSCKKEYFGA